MQSPPTTLSHCSRRAPTPPPPLAHFYKIIVLHLRGCLVFTSLQKANPVLGIASTFYPQSSGAWRLRPRTAAASLLSRIDRRERARPAAYAPYALNVLPAPLPPASAAPSRPGHAHRRARTRSISTPTPAHRCAAAEQQNNVSKRFDFDLFISSGTRC